MSRRFCIWPSKTRFVTVSDALFVTVPSSDTNLCSCSMSAVTPCAEEMTFVWPSGLFRTMALPTTVSVESSVTSLVTSRTAPSSAASIALCSSSPVMAKAHDPISKEPMTSKLFFIPTIPFVKVRNIVSHPHFRGNRFQSPRDDNGARPARLNRVQTTECARSDSR